MRSLDDRDLWTDVVRGETKMMNAYQRAAGASADSAAANSKQQQIQGAGVDAAPPVL